ncbi:MAG TPA: hypothetical protein VN676_10335 [Steroidobacteraceae bacterium]|nr:hypothetical protein [Steroidobacteraceae bacterium]
MSKIPASVGPQSPHVIVLVGATGDLARRKLLPGLFAEEQIFRIDHRQTARRGPAHHLHRLPRAPEEHVERAWRDPNRQGA